MPLDGLFDNIIWLIYVFSVILVLIMIFLERSAPQTIMFWTSILLLLPLLSFAFPQIGPVLPITGFLLYLCFGQTFYNKRQFRLKNLTDEKLHRIQTEDLKTINTSHILPEHREGERFSETLMNAGGSLFTVNNDVRLYTKGEDFFRYFLNDLRNAKKFIHAEFYIVRNDELANEFMDILIQKAKEGVEVRLQIDAIGNNSGPRKKLKELKNAGGEFAIFNRLITVLLSPRKNNRNHRKVAVIDGNIGYVSGFNIGDEYIGKGPMGDWRDSGVRIEGYGALPINLRFLMDWGYASKKHIEFEKKYFPLPDKEYGDMMTQLISGGPDSRQKTVKMQYLNIISSAKRTLYIHTPYLVPDDSTRDALILAAYSGVDVRIIIPDLPDHMFVYWITLWNAGELMKRGVRIFQYNNGFVHSKTLVADGEFCSVGSANLDRRSMNLNFETNSMIISKRIGSQMDSAFAEDLKRCTEYSLEEHAKMSAWNKFKMSISVLFSPLA